MVLGFWFLVFFVLAVVWEPREETITIARITRHYDIRWHLRSLCSLEVDMQEEEAVALIYDSVRVTVAYLVRGKKDTYSI